MNIKNIFKVFKKIKIFKIKVCLNIVYINTPDTIPTAYVLKINELLHYYLLFYYIKESIITYIICGKCIYIIYNIHYCLFFLCRNYIIIYNVHNT